MFSNIHIQHFKTFENFTAKDFKIINTITGDNNTGKTTLLEAIFLLSGYFDVGLIERLFSWRNLRLAEKGDLNYLFSHLQLNKKINIKGLYNNNNININYQALLQKDGSISGIEADFKYNGKGNGKSRLVYNPQKLDYSIPGLSIQQESPFLINDNPNRNNSQKLEHINTKIFHSSFLPNQLELLGDFTEVMRQGKKEELIKILNNLFRKDIMDIFNANNIIEILTKENQKSLPFTFLGGGMQKILPIFCTIVNGNRKVILIDEIENGLHYSKKKAVLYFLFKQAIEKKTQLFITTHDADTIEVINDILQEDEENKIKDHFQHHVLYNNKDNQKKSINYSAEEFIASNQTSKDIRN